MENIKDLLESWGIPQEITSRFLENGITVEHFPKITSEDLKELCPHMGTRLLLKEKISDIVTAGACTETNTSVLTEFENPSIIEDTGLIISLDDVSSIFNSSIPRKAFPNFDLDTLLQTSAGGSSILKYYETFGYLDNTKRNQLTDIIIKHIIYTYIVNCRITYEEYNVIAAKIISLFPKESIGTYFTKPIKKIHSPNGRFTIARGKLVDKVCNLLYKYGDRKRPSSVDLNTPPAKKHHDELHELYLSDIIF